MKHHLLLHENKADQSANAQAVSSVVGISTSLNIIKPADKVYFRVIPIILHGRKKKVSTFALYDEGSSMTIMEASLMNDLELDSRDTKFSMQG